MRSVPIRPRRGLSLLQLLAVSGESIAADCGGNGRCGKCRVRIEVAGKVEEVLACRCTPAAPLKVILPDIPPPPARSRKPSAVLSLAADFGTTTISLAAVDPSTGRVARRATELNPQAVLGADVMSRIGAARLVRRVDIGAPVRRFLSAAGISPKRRAVVVGNTAMMHFALGRSPARLGIYPYRTELYRRVPLSGRFAYPPGMAAWSPPLLGSFVGSDCSAAIIASGMHLRHELSLLVDAGTNGEIALGNRDRILVCSTAAGPAFEGATLECGSLARRGAITAVRAGAGNWEVTTVGGARPNGICGSGVLSAVAAGLGTGAIEPGGRVAAGHLTLADGVYLSQADIREVQLAKAAVAAGIAVLLAEWPARDEDVGRVHLTGRFGAALDTQAAAAIGLIPSGLTGRVRQHSNLALAGAARLLVGSARRAATELGKRCREVRLSEHPEFEKHFVDRMELAPWQ